MTSQDSCCRSTSFLNQTKLYNLNRQSESWNHNSKPALLLRTSSVLWQGVDKQPRVTKPKPMIQTIHQHHPGWSRWRLVATLALTFTVLGVVSSQAQSK